MDEDKLVFDIKSTCCLTTWWIKLFGTKVSNSDAWTIYAYRGRYYFTDMKIDEET